MILSVLKNKLILLSLILVAKEQLFFVPAKLQLGFLHANIAYRLGLKICDPSTIYQKLIVVFAKVLKTVLKKFKNGNCVFNCTNIFIENLI